MAWVAFIAVLLVGLFSRYFSKGRVELLVELYRNAYHHLADEMEEKLQSHELMNDVECLRLLGTIQKAARTGFLEEVSIPTLVFSVASSPKDALSNAPQPNLPIWLRGYADRRNQLLVEFLAKRHPFVAFLFLVASPFLIVRTRETV